MMMIQTAVSRGSVCLCLCLSLFVWDGVQVVRVHQRIIDDDVVVVIVVS